MSLPNLANEILFLIADNLNLADLNSLIQVNRCLAASLTPNFRKSSLEKECAAAALYCAAAVHADKDLVRILLEEGKGISVLGDITARPLHTAPGKASDEVIRFVLSKGPHLVLEGGIALHWAAAKGRTNLVRLLLENGADIGVRGTMESITALHQACIGSMRNEAVINLLLDSGADIAAKDIHGSSVLDWAVMQNNYAATKLLIERGADIHSQDPEGTTALHVAASLEDGSLVQLLLEKGAYVNSKDYGGMTALHVAASRGHEAVVRLLLHNGADINAQDGRSWSRFQLTALGGEISITHLQKKRTNAIVQDFGGNDTGTSLYQVKRTLVAGVTVEEGNGFRYHARILRKGFIVVRSGELMANDTSQEIQQFGFKPPRPHLIGWVYRSKAIAAAMHRLRGSRQITCTSRVGMSLLSSRERVELRYFVQHFVYCA